MVNICLGHSRHGKIKINSSMLISSLHNDDILICMPQKKKKKKITNTFKNRYTYLSFVDCEFKKLTIL
jgi:hypothetical protein